MYCMSYRGLQRVDTVIGRIQAVAEELHVKYI